MILFIWRSGKGGILGTEIRLVTVQNMEKIAYKGQKSVLGGDGTVLYID